MILFLIPLILIGCSTTSEPKNSNDNAIEYESTPLRTGIRALEVGRYEDAKKFFLKYLEKNPVNRYTTAAHYYLGLSDLNLDLPLDAVSRFQTVIGLTRDRDVYMQAEALYNLGRAQEAAGFEAEALAAYLDAERRSQYLPDETAQVEVPARIAGVYARQGQMKTADRYYQKADQGFEKLKSRSKLEKQDWLARALFTMGQMSPRKILLSDFESELKSLNRSQAYLIRAVEFGHEIWSDKASKELEVIYNSAWKTIESTPVTESEDRLASLKQQQEKMIEMGLLLNTALERAKQEFVPGVRDNRFLNRSKVFFEEFEKKLDALLATRPVHEGLTPESQKLEGIKREGVVIDPSGKLEKENKRLPEVLPVKKKQNE